MTLPINWALLDFTTPWVLSLLVFLPALLLILKATPPSPRLVKFPPITLLMGLKSQRDQTHHTPLWLLILRLFLVALLIIAGAGPIYDATHTSKDGTPLILVVDDGWASAAHWDHRKETMARLLDRAERQNSPVLLLTTAPEAQNLPSTPSLLRASQARRIAQALSPKPWPTDRQAAAKALSQFTFDRPATSIWLSDGVEDAGGGGGAARALATRLQRLGRLELLVPAPADMPLILHPPQATGDRLTIALSRPDSKMAPPKTVWLRAMDGDGRILAREGMTFPLSKSRTEMELILPPELRNRVERLDIEGQRSASATVLLDERWRRRPVGLVSGNPLNKGLPLLSDLYYLKRALTAGSDVRQGSVKELLDRDLSMMVLADVGKMPQAETSALTRWIEDGGVLVRFAGEHVGNAPDDTLLPVPLRRGGRSMGGALSWDKPRALAPFPDKSPFAGLKVSDEVRISSQILAQPGAAVADRTWATLSDGTPLVTGEARGKGWLVLVHTTANAQWSNLPLSGLFVDMLGRLLDLSTGITGKDGNRSLPPLRVLDGKGRLGLPGETVRPIPAGDVTAIEAGPLHPPGIYGTKTARRALNLASSLPKLTPLNPPQGVRTTAYDKTAAELDLTPWLLALAIVLLMADTIATMRLRGVSILKKAATAVFVFLSLASPAGAADNFDLEAALDTRLAYIRTGTPSVDSISDAGLSTLTRLVGRRSAAELAPPFGIDIETDPLLFFPMIYWPVTSNQGELSPGAQAKVNDYMRRGGLILFDDKETDGAMQRLLSNLDIPTLNPVSKDHVINRSFYLLVGQPGRITGGTLWIATDSEANDGVSPVIIGNRDWAGAWAADEATEAPLLPVNPGGPRQREMAYRFGINVIMYALTGNYKTDQVHLPAIMERLTQ